MVPILIIAMELERPDLMIGEDEEYAQSEFAICHLGMLLAILLETQTRLHISNTMVS